MDVNVGDLVLECASFISCFFFFVGHFIFNIHITDVLNIRQNTGPNKELELMARQNDQKDI
jgi:hypothetical protein